VKLKMTTHAKHRLEERFGMKDLPARKPVFVKKISHQRKVYKVDDIYIVLRLKDKRVITVLTEDICKDIFHGRI